MTDIREAEAVEKIIQDMYDTLEKLPSIETTESLTEPIRELVEKIREHYSIELVTCVSCKRDTPAITAHLHQDEWIGDSCCWDERLRATE